MLGVGGGEVSVIPVFYPHWIISVSSLGSFRLLVHHLNLLILPFLFLSEYTVFKSISRRRWGGIEKKSSHRGRRPDTSIRCSKRG